MRLGIFSLDTYDSEDPAKLAKRAEELGFASFWVPDHTVIPVATTSSFPGSPDGVIPERYSRIGDPFVSLARASAVTERIKLATGICLIPERNPILTAKEVATLPERNPILTAKEVATLDHLSGGRFLFGIGAGWLKEETEVMGGDFPHRWTQTRDAILAMKELWTKEESEYHGRYFDFPAVRCFPKPAQKPHPPIYLGGDAKKVFDRIVEYGDGWLPVNASADRIRDGRATLREAADRAGRDPACFEVLVLGRAGEYRDRDSVRRLEGTGVDEVIVWLDPEDGLPELEKVAAELMG